MRSPVRRVKRRVLRITQHINHHSVTLTRNLGGYVSHFRRWALPVFPILFLQLQEGIFSRINHGHAYVEGAFITRLGTASPIQITLEILPLKY